jgi:aryl-alcohol dehydrogenase-like predicted oxidoreductase
LCERQNLAALNRGPLAMGVLTGKYTAGTKVAVDDVRGEKSPDWMKYFSGGRPAPEWLAKRDAVREILQSGGRSVAQGALAWLWARSPQTIPIPGFRTESHVRENTGAMQYGPLKPEQMREIEKLLGRS